MPNEVLLNIMKVDIPDRAALSLTCSRIAGVAMEHEVLDFDSSYAPRAVRSARSAPFSGPKVTLPRARATLWQAG